MMPGPEPVAEPIEFSWDWDAPEPFHPDEVRPAPWAHARSALEQATVFWLATIRRDGRPHVRPVLAVMVDGVLHFCASDRSAKGRNLARDPRCDITTRGDSFDLVVEGRAATVGDEDVVRRVADAYADKYDWRPAVIDGGLWGDGAPTAGPPPYRVYRLGPTRAFGFPTDDVSIPTRWVF